MLRVGLTGGIGSGKSTVSAMLAELGAHVIDADVIARSLVSPDGPALAAIVAAFGPQVVGSDGQLDRASLAGVVFGDDGELAKLEAIMHPLIADVAEGQLAAAAADGAAVAVYDMPLLTETAASHTFDLVVVVTAPLSTRLARLAERGVAPEEARRRMARQATDEQRAQGADVLLDNSGDIAHLREQVGQAWELMAQRARSGHSEARPPERT